jgi:fructose-1-phosphate kinase PfkB-like protein
MHVTLCVNPVFDMIFESCTHRSGERLFFSRSHRAGGGFGLNVSRALAVLSCESICFMLIGGEAGQWLCNELRNEAINWRHYPIEGDTRVAALWLAGEDSRMLVSPSPTLGAVAMRHVFEQVLAATGQGQLVFIGGSVAEEDEPLYVDLIRMLCRSRTCCCDVRTALDGELIGARPFMLRLASPVGNLETRLASLRKALAMGVSVVVQTSGPGELLLGSSSGIFRIQPPRVSVVNPFGAGDCLMAVLAKDIYEGKAMCAAARHATAAAAASVLTPLPGYFRVEDAAQLESKVRIDVLEGARA